MEGPRIWVATEEIAFESGAAYPRPSPVELSLGVHVEYRIALGRR